MRRKRGKKIYLFQLLHRTFEVSQYDYHRQKQCISSITWQENCSGKTAEAGSGMLAINLGLWVQNGTVQIWGVSLETDAGEGQQKAVCLLGSVFTFLRVILALRVEQSGGPTCSRGWSVADRLASAVACGWYIKTHMDINLQHTNHWNCYLCFC